MNITRTIRNLLHPPCPQVREARAKRKAAKARKGEMAAREVERLRKCRGDFENVVFSDCSRSWRSIASCSSRSISSV